MNKVSGFKLAENVIKSLCKEYSYVFKDIEITFDEGKTDALFIGETKNISHTIYKIVDLYLQKSPQIIGEHLIYDAGKRDDFLIGLANYLRGLVYTNNTFSEHVEGMHRQKLYQRPLVWLMMKDIICPIYDKPLKNINLVCGETPYIDIARFYTEDELKKEGKGNDPFIFINIIDNINVLSAFLIIETIKSYGLSPVEVIKDIYDGELYDKFYGLLRLSLNSEKNIVELENVLLNILGIDFISLNRENKNGYFNTKKVAQNMYPETSSQWWYLGVTERLLEPTRGEDWSTYYNLEKYVESFWNNVEKLREKKAKKGGESSQLPFNKLLELKKNQTTDYKDTPSRTIQHTLSDTRVW